MTDAITMTSFSPSPTSPPQEKRRGGRKAKRRKPISKRAVDESIRDNIGVDIGDKHSHICEIDEKYEIRECQITTTEKGFREEFEGKPRRRIIIEMGSQSRWIDELLVSLGHEVMVLDTRQLQLVSATLHKDDKTDAYTLATMGKEAPGLLKVVKHRGLEQQKVLMKVRARACLVQSRTRIVNTLRGLLKPFGYRLHKDCHSLEFVFSLFDVVPESIRDQLIPMMPVFQELNVSIARYDKEAEKLLPTFAPDALNLLTINGVGALTVLYFVALIGDPKRFTNSRDVGAYCGLCRRRNESGEKKSELRITKAGDRYMRALLVNCASYILGPFGKDSDLRTWGKKRQGGCTKVEKRKAKVALARKLAVLLLTLWKTGKTYVALREQSQPQQA